MAPHAPAPVLAVFLALSAASPLLAQDQSWEGKIVSNVDLRGFRYVNKGTTLNTIGIKRGETVTKEKVDQAYKELFKSGKFQDIDIKPQIDPANNQQAIVIITVTEYILVENVEFRGINEIPLNTIKTNLLLAAGEPLNPFHLKRDREYIRDQYLLKGYHFSSVEESTRPGTTGVILSWSVVEGPMVSVEAIVFTGDITVNEGTLKDFVRVIKENDSIFGIIPTGKNPFDARMLPDAIERVKLFYRLEGWLDIHHGNNVFLEDLIFNEEKTRVVIKIHIDEGARYRVRKISFEFDPSSRRIFPEDEMRKWLLSKPGEPYIEFDANKDVQKIQEKYGEKAYIQAEITHTEVVALNAKELDLVYSIKENEKIYVGRLIFEGNSKTREDVLRREFTRTGFLPGEEYNNTSLQRAILRIRDRQVLDQQQGIAVRTLDTDDPHTRDVFLDVKEGQTGTVRFAAGYSSSYGITGIVEFTQRNFDIADLPTSFDDLIGGTGFAGGGQFLRIRAAPAARQQSYTADFREPYVFGYEFGLGLRGYQINTLRESYDERRTGSATTIDKRWDPLTLSLTFDEYRIAIEQVAFGAPPAVKELVGRHSVFSLTPALTIDTRDSFIMPTSGMRFMISEMYAGQILPGSFDFNKLTIETEGHVTLYETEGHLKHVGSVWMTFGYASGIRQTEDVPIFERFYAGGRGGPRGFDFRGMGPHENGDPVGGDALALFTVEYTYPIFVEFLRGAFFYDLANLTPDIYGLKNEKWRNVIGFGIRFFIPQLGNIPVKLDFGFPMTLQRQDRRQTVTFDIGTFGF